MPNVNDQTIYQAGSALAALAQQATARGALGVAVPGEFISAAATAIDFTEIFGPGDLVKFAAAYPRPIRSLTIDMNPIQAGSGDPAPDNPRAISGRTGANVYVSPTENIADATTYAVAFGDAGTVYGGTLDVITGELIVNKAIVDLGALTWRKTTDGEFGTIIFWTANAELIKSAMVGTTEVPDAICTIYNPRRRYGSQSLIQYGYTGFNISQDTIRIVDADKSSFTVDEFKASVNGKHICYKLATPLEYELTPQQIFTLLGSNNVWSNAGPVTVEL